VVVSVVLPLANALRASAQIEPAVIDTQKNLETLEYTFITWLVVIFWFL
jgi:hypothetical protein